MRKYSSRLNVRKNYALLTILVQRVYCSTCTEPFHCLLRVLCPGGNRRHIFHEQIETVAERQARSGSRFQQCRIWRLVCSQTAQCLLSFRHLVSTVQAQQTANHRMKGPVIMIDCVIRCMVSVCIRVVEQNHPLWTKTHVE